MKTLAPIIVLLALASPALAQHEFFMPTEQFERFKNRVGPKGEGSCVQASLSMVGAHHAVPAAELLLVPSPYGPPELDGSWPERVAEYSQKRGMDIYNVEGAQTVAWIEWALHRGCYVGVTYGQAHMIAAVGISPDGRDFYVCDNNFPSEIRRVDRDTFIREHRSHGGGWCVILKTPGPPPWAAARPEPKP